MVHHRRATQPSSTGSYDNVGKYHAVVVSEWQRRFLPTYALTVAVSSCHYNLLSWTR